MDRDQKLTYALVFIFACVGAVGLARHEMWRDELLSWDLARDSRSLTELWQNMQNEPHPILWPALLFPLAHFTTNPAAMQCVHWLIAVASVFLFVRFAPFTSFQKILFCFGYYPLYEYCVISRNYSLCMLLLFSFCVLAQRPSRNYIALALIIGLLAGAHFYDLLISWTLIALLVLDCVRDRNERERFLRHKASAVAAVCIILLCQAFAAAQAWRYACNTPAYSSTGFHLSKLATALTSMWRMFVPIPLVTVDTFGWNTNLWADSSRMGHQTADLLAGVLIIVLGWLFWLRNRRAFFMYAVGTSLLMMAQFAVGFGPLRHAGKYYLVILAAYWLTGNTSVSSATRAGNVLNKLITVLLLIHVAAAGICYGFDLRYVFSAAKPTVQFLRDHHFDQRFIAVTPDSLAPAISGYLGKKVYAADSQRMQSFISIDATNYAHTSTTEDAVARQMLNTLSAATNQIVLITGSRLVVGEDSQPLEILEFPPDRRVAKLAEFTKSISDEKCCLYLFEKVPGALHQ